ncbi:hypothetical protein D1007_04948 [Hordeum vulgare]|nr:hypothetical protein D1007_04948 [Hordeum vulgare]
MASFAGSSSSGACGDLPIIWPTSLDALAMKELHRYALMIPPGWHLAKAWKVNTDGYATLGPATTAEECRNHRSGRHNIYGQHAFWDGKSYADVINQHRRASATAGNPVNPGGSQRRPRRQALTPQPPRVAPHVAQPEVELLPEQVVLREDGDPDDSQGLLVALRASLVTAAKEEAEIAAAIHAAAENPQAVVEDDNDDID